MRKYYLFPIYILLIACSIYFACPALAWYDETHLAVAKAAGYYKWYNAVGADMAKVKAGSIESKNHFYDNPDNINITPEIVLNQAQRYNDPRDKDGHLYGAIIASIREYKEQSAKGKYAEYHLAFCAHYITDLSQPLHNIPYDNFNKSHHLANDGAVEREVLQNIDSIREHMYLIPLRDDNFENNFAEEIARIAILSRALGLRLKKENRNMTRQEIYVQLGHSASLFKALLEHLSNRVQN